MKISIWKVRNFHEPGKMHNIFKKMKKLNMDILGTSYGLGEFSNETFLHEVHIYLVNLFPLVTKRSPKFYNRLHEKVYLEDTAKNISPVTEQCKTLI